MCIGKKGGMSRKEKKKQMAYYSEDRRGEGKLSDMRERPWEKKKTNNSLIRR